MDPASVRSRAVVLGLCLFLSLAAQALAQDVTIDFEHYPGPDGLLGTADDVPTPTTVACYPPPCEEGPVDELRDQYSPVGITFSQGTLAYFPSFWPGHQHFISSTETIATLSRTARAISITSYSYWDATLTAYDATDNVIGTSVLTHPSPGGSTLLGTLTVRTAEPIARFSVLPDNPQHILNLDDLHFGDGRGSSRWRRAGSWTRGTGAEGSGDHRSPPGPTGSSRSTGSAGFPPAPAACP
jgi:hypothetical protein